MTEQHPDYKVVNSRIMKRLSSGLALLVAVGASIALGAHWYGPTIAMGGHSEDRNLHQITIGNNMLSVPANEIRFDHARADRAASRLDLYLHYPSMEGYSSVRSAAFNLATDQKELIFLSFEESSMSRDMSGRLEPIYRALIEPTPARLEAGLQVYAFTQQSGYRDEELIISNDALPFVARCLTPSKSIDMAAPCERDLQFAEGLTLTYRFPRALLEHWQDMEAAIRTRAQTYLRQPS